jgi:hypothetical protein
MNEAPITPIKTIFLVGVDSSAFSLLATERAFALAKGETDQVILLDVMPKGSQPCTINIDKIHGRGASRGTWSAASRVRKNC